MDQLQPSPPNSSPLTPVGFLERAATVYPECPAVVYNSSTCTWSEIHRRCLRMASSISSLGIKRRDVVSVLAPNIPAMYELHFAVPMVGAVLNTINLRLDAHTISVILRHAESKLVFVDFQSQSLVLEALSLFPPRSERPLLVRIADDGESGVALDDSPAEKNGHFCADYEGLIASGDPNFDWIRPASEFDPITLNYTSGTTSAPKGVVHCHRGAFLVAVDSLAEWSVPKEAVYLWTLPMFHANGWSYTWGMAAAGATNVCLRRFDAAAVLTAIDRYGVTHMCGAPVVLNMLSSLGRPLSRPVHILTAGAPPPAPVLRRTEALGFVVSHGYGLTETGGLAVCCSWKKGWDRLSVEERARLKSRQGVRTLGMAGVDVVVPGTGASVARDGKSLGEIVLGGGSVMLGYFKDPKGTARCMRGGWFYTGDVGVVHPDGYLEIKDRSKDVIISGGENISSVEVEAVLYGHPAVSEAAVVARPDEFWGETPCAFVSVKEGGGRTPNEGEVVEYCRGRLPGFMVPRTVVFMAELPKTSTGKIQKFALREEARAMGPTACAKVSRL